MRRAAGYAQIVDPDRPLEEFDLAGCCHCGAQIRVKPLTASTVYLIFDPRTWRWVEVPGASCWHCLKPVCLACHAKGTCTPLERMLDRLERPRG
jgi:hypothetical protein